MNGRRTHFSAEGQLSLSSKLSYKSISHKLLSCTFTFASVTDPTGEIKTGQCSWGGAARPLCPPHRPPAPWSWTAGSQCTLLSAPLPYAPWWTPVSAPLHAPHTSALIWCPLEMGFWDLWHSGLKCKSALRSHKFTEAIWGIICFGNSKELDKSWHFYGLKYTWFGKMWISNAGVMFYKYNPKFQVLLCCQKLKNKS